MTDANYVRHFSVLGKLAKLYDDANANEATQKTLIAVTADQMANSLSTGLANFITMTTYIQQFYSALTAGETTRKEIAINAGRAYLKDSYFYGGLTATPTDLTSPAAILIAFAADMVTNSKTISTETTSGLVNFFDALSGTEGTYPTSGSPTYDDATYVVETIVAD